MQPRSFCLLFGDPPPPIHCGCHLWKPPLVTPISAASRGRNISTAPYSKSERAQSLVFIARHSPSNCEKRLYYVALRMKRAACKTQEVSSGARNETTIPELFLAAADEDLMSPQKITYNRYVLELE